MPTPVALTPKIQAILFNGNNTQEVIDFLNSWGTVFGSAWGVDPQFTIPNGVRLSWPDGAPGIIEMHAGEYVLCGYGTPGTASSAALVAALYDGLPE